MISENVYDLKAKWIHDQETDNCNGYPSHSKIACRKHRRDTVEFFGLSYIHVNRSIFRRCLCCRYESRLTFVITKAEYRMRLYSLQYWPDIMIRQSLGRVVAVFY